ncbi:hypothetical protein Clacol_007318 [Clathrus columnatus]|uniref:Acyl-coenzyme A oxidase n=1 Tax=Clathrus columnatus TaxID=1419009 RepID=A0AAV5AIW3_9AGAM|nr:hypothetical protein Clacol_007318 [Clathrus columnatus]
MPGCTNVDIAEVKHFLWSEKKRDGKLEWEKHENLVRILSNDPVFDKWKRLYMGRKDRYINGLAIYKRLVELKEQHQWSDAELDIALSLSEEGTGFGLHSMGGFVYSFADGSPEQVETIGKQAIARAIIGAYAQTELAHGTQVSHLETTATYIPEAREFELHTPRLESSKWWIGGLARTATHCVVQARLILPEGDKGPHLFLLQIRNLGSKSYGALPGVDNGFMRLSRVRVPLSAMLSRFASVTETGKYNKPLHPKLNYGGMVYIRAGLISQGGWQTAKAITIAIRYTNVRRQGGGSLGHEKQVITYPSTYHRLLPILSRAFVWIFMGRSMTQLYSELSAQLAQNSTALLAETHAVSSGLKVLVTSISTEDLETARRCMGGHGFLAVAGIGTMWAQWVPSNTYEGDNYVLVQQVVRAAVKNLQAFLSFPNVIDAAASLPPSVFCLRHLVNPISVPVDPFSIPGAIHLLELRGACMVFEHNKRVQAKEIDGSADWRVARAVTEAFVARQVGQLVQDLDKRLSEKSAETLSTLLRLARSDSNHYLLTTLEAALVDLLSLDLLPSKKTPSKLDSASSHKDSVSIQEEFRDRSHELRSTIALLEEELLPHAIGLSDAFGFTDWELNSALGVKDGRVYETLWERTQLDPLNETDIVGYEEYLKPIMEYGRNILEMDKAALAKL